MPPSRVSSGEPRPISHTTGAGLPLRLGSLREPRSKGPDGLSLTRACDGTDVLNRRKRTNADSTDFDQVERANQLESSAQQIV